MNRYTVKVTESFEVIVDAESKDKAKEIISKEIPKHSHKGLSRYIRRHAFRSVELEELQTDEICTSSRGFYTALKREYNALYEQRQHHYDNFLYWEDRYRKFGYRPDAERAEKDLEKYEKTNKEMKCLLRNL